MSILGLGILEIIPQTHPYTCASANFIRFAPIQMSRSLCCHQHPITVDTTVPHAEHRAQYLLITVGLLVEQDMVVGLEVFNGCPPPFKSVEGMVVGGFNDFAVNGQEGDGIGVFPNGGDFMFARFAIRPYERLLSPNALARP